MTSDAERYLRDIEAAAAAVGALPDDYRTLRQLLASLPPGTAPSLKQGAAAQLGDAVGAGGVNTSGLSLESGLPVGSQSGASLGILPQLVFGQTNLIVNPELVAVERTAALVSGVAAVVGPAWTARYVLNSGTNPTGKVTVTNLNDRGEFGMPFNTDAILLSVAQLASAAVRDVDIYVYPTAAHSAVNGPTLPYLTAAVRVENYDAKSVPAHWTTADMIMEIVRTSDGAVVASSTPLRLRDLDGKFEARSLSALTQQTDAAFRATTWTWRLRLHLVSDGSAVTAIDSYAFAEPQLSFTYTADPPPFAPLIGRWIPDELKAYDPGKTFPNLQAWNGNAGYGELLFGSGDVAGDVRVTRTATKELTVGDGVVPFGPVRMKHVGPHFVQGPNAMDLAITYGAFGPTNVSRDDEGVLVSSSVITYNGAGTQVLSIVTSRFGKTITTIPTYTGANITSIARDVT